MLRVNHLHEELLRSSWWWFCDNFFTGKHILWVLITSAMWFLVRHFNEYQQHLLNWRHKTKLFQNNWNLILAYSWARPAIHAAGKGSRGIFLFCFFTFMNFSLSLLSLSFISCTTSSVSLLPFSGRWHKMTHKGWCIVKPQHKETRRPRLLILGIVALFCGPLLRLFKL